MSVDEKLRQQLQELKRGKINCFPATVKSVDRDTNTITVIDGFDLEYDDVRLTAIFGGKSALICYPKVETTVLVNIINSQENELVASAFEEIEELLINVDTVNLIVNKDGIQMNGDAFSIVKAEELKTVMDTNAAFIDVFKQVLKTVPPITEPGNGAPSALQAALSSALGTLQWGDHSQIHNDKVKHGS